MKRICADCQHHQAAPSAHLRARCLRPQQVDDPVTGASHDPINESCALQRIGNWLECRIAGTCGKGARFFSLKVEWPRKSS